MNPTSQPPIAEPPTQERLTLRDRYQRSRTFMENVVVFPDGSAVWTCVEEQQRHSSPTIRPVPPAIAPASATDTIHGPRSTGSWGLGWVAGFAVLLVPFCCFSLWTKNTDFQPTPPISCKTP